jgi:hypothetical protein
MRGPFARTVHGRGGDDDRDEEQLDDEENDCLFLFLEMMTILQWNVGVVLLPAVPIGTQTAVGNMNVASNPSGM